MRLLLGMAWVGCWLGLATAGRAQESPSAAEHFDDPPGVHVELPVASDAPQPSADEPAPPQPVTEQILAVAESHAISGWDPRGDASPWLIAPADSLRLGLENVLVTADGDLTPLLATPELALTDLVLLRLSAGYSIGGDVELLAGLTLVPKQPIATDAPALAGGVLGARVGLVEAWATSLVASAGPTIDGAGAWANGVWTVDARYFANAYIVFDGSAGIGATTVSVASDTVALTELVFGGEAILQEPRKAAITAGIDFAIPFWHGEPESKPLDPQTRVSVHVAGILSLADQWDIALRGAVIDRGELNAPSSVLPILDGGFDQRQITLGVTYRSEERDPDFAQ